MTQVNTTATQTAADFTGTLLQRKHKLGEKFVQLVFRDQDHDVICITSNLRTATLPVGQSYHVEGLFTRRGKREVVVDPKIADPTQHRRTVRRAMVVLVVLSCITGVGSVAYMQHGPIKAQPPIPSMQPAPDVRVSTY